MGMDKWVFLKNIWFGRRLRKPPWFSNVTVRKTLSSRAQVTVVNQKERHSELAEESRRSHPRRLLARMRFLGKLGMTFFFIRLLTRGHLAA